MSVEREIRGRPILTSQTSWRLLAAAVCLGLLLWLVFQPSPTERRRTAIDNALREGRIGQLSPDQTAWMSTTVSWMAGAAGVTDPVALNAPFLAGRLNVYTTTPASSTVTHCGRGNAVYDAELDAIFLDQGLFDNNDFRTFLSASAYGSVGEAPDTPEECALPKGWHWHAYSRRSWTVLAWKSSGTGRDLRKRTRERENKTVRRGGLKMVMRKARGSRHYRLTCIQGAPSAFQFLQDIGGSGSPQRFGAVIMEVDVPMSTVYQVVLKSPRCAGGQSHDGPFRWRWGS
jgi:hypothetical protein